MSEDHVLIGRTLTGLQIAEDKQALRFLTLEGDEIIARTDGDCCSLSWVEHIELPARGFPARVLVVEEISMPEPDQDGHDCLAAYGCKISTDRGEIVIEYRNSSNGYYGGDLVWPDDPFGFYGGVFGQNVSEEVWTVVEE